MKKSYLIFALTIIIAFCLGLTGCALLEPAAVESTEEAEVPTVEVVEDPDTDENLDGDSGEGSDGEVPSAGDQEFVSPAGTIVTDISQIEGTWIAAAYPGNFVLTISSDGTLSVATSLEDLESGSTDTWQLTIEDGQITASGFALCPGEVGLYIGTIKYNDLLRFTSVVDPCEPRLRKMDRSLPGRLREYFLLYYPVY